MSEVLELNRLNEITQPDHYGNGSMSALDGTPVGLSDSVSRRNRRWTVIVAEMTDGSRKRRAKTRVRAALSTENPPDPLH